MTKHNRLLLLIALTLSACVCLAMIGGGQKAATHGPRELQTAALHKTNATQTNSRVQTIQFNSKLMGRRLPYNVVLPVGYEQPGAMSKRYAVLYLLHGLM